MNLFSEKNTPPVLFGPMAGVSDHAYRRIVKPFGPDLMFTEMVSAKALYYKDQKTAKLLTTSAEEAPVSVQLFGHDPDMIAYGAKTVEQLGFPMIDINAGCPTPKIVNNGDGSALMKDPVLLGRVIESAVNSVCVPVSVKLRLGWDAESINACECAKIAQECGAAFITIHGRTREMFYSGTANRAEIKKVVKHVRVPVIANGDVFDYKDALILLRETGAAGVMVARGALGNPWIFKRIQNALTGQDSFCYPDTASKLAMARKHLRLLVEIKGEHIGVLEARKHAAWYLKGVRGANALKEQLFRAQSQREMEALLRPECL